MKVLGLHYDDPHPVHKAWMEEVGDVMRLEIDHEPSPTNIFRYALNARKIPDDYDVLLCEGGTALRTAVVKKLFNPDLKIVRMVVDQGLYECVEGEKRCLEERLTHRFVDGAIANSEFMKKYADKYIDGPVEVVYPFIPDIEKFLSIEKEDYDTKNILFIGYNYPNKNVESLVKAVEGTEYTLHIVGKGHPEHPEENVETHGYVEDLVPFMEKADLYVQPSNGEAFGVAPAEAMAAGVPAIVTESTGLKEQVSEIDSQLVCGSSAKELSSALEYYYSLEAEDREKRGLKSRERAKLLSRERKCREFSNKFNQITFSRDS